MSGPDLRVTVGDLELENPVLAASGTFGYGLELVDLCPPETLGGVVTKGLSPRPRAGAPMPRIAETASGMLNAIGLENIGVEAFCTEKLPGLRERGATVIVNVFGESPPDYVTVIERCEAEEGIAGYELNVSCPNVSSGGIEFGHDPDLLRALTERCRSATERPLWVKLSPNAPDLVATARAAVDGGADALSLINTVRAMAIDPWRRRPELARTFGGLSGPAILPIALRMVFEVHRELPEVPLVGLGGIESGLDVVRFLLAGASAVQVGTATFRRPGAMLEILAELAAYCEQTGTATLSELTGALEV
ncbi:MAG TPA: dihydroorotate dehydrogenase [Acidobacteria bacterium]|nr:dihydroorotate dehydrogenase [Acidobacteriota bacterium]